MLWTAFYKRLCVLAPMLGWAFFSTRAFSSTHGERLDDIELAVGATGVEALDTPPEDVLVSPGDKYFGASTGATDAMGIKRILWELFSKVCGCQSLSCQLHKFRMQRKAQKQHRNISERFCHRDV